MPQDCSGTSNAAARSLNDVLFGDHITPPLQRPRRLPGVRQGDSAGPQALLETRLGLGAMGFLPRSQRSRSAGGAWALGGRRTWMGSCRCRALEPARQSDGASSRRHRELSAPTGESICRNLKPVLTLDGPQEVDPAIIESDCCILIRLEWVSQAYFSSTVTDKGRSPFT